MDGEQDRFACAHEHTYEYDFIRPKYVDFRNNNNMHHLRSSEM